MVTSYEDAFSSYRFLRFFYRAASALRIPIVGVNNCRSWVRVRVGKGRRLHKLRLNSGWLSHTRRKFHRQKVYGVSESPDAEAIVQTVDVYGTHASMAYTSASTSDAEQVVSLAR